MIGTTNVVNKKASETERINLTLQTNQSSHTDLNGVKFSVSYGSYTKSYTWQGSSFTIEVPAFVEYTITFGAIDDYATPAPLSYVAQVGNSRTVTAKYNTEIVSVDLIVDVDDQSADGQIVTINGIQHTWKGETITQKVAFGTEYSVSVNDMSGFVTPSVETFTASKATRSVYMVYYSMVLGVYIQGVSGLLYPKSLWSNQETPNGIAVLTDKCRFVIALSNANGSYCAFSYDTNAVNGVTSTTNETEAIQDYDGEAQTIAILNQYGSNAVAANYCRSFIFPNGKSGYLGSAGEWKAVLDNIDAINAALYACNGEDIHYPYWTSTLYSMGSSCWVMYSYGRIMTWQYYTNENMPRAFASL